MEGFDKIIPDFSNILLGNTKLSFENYNILVSDNSFNNNSSLFMSMFIAFFLKNNYKVIFVSCNESLIHQNSLCKKHGINLTNNENLYYIDCFYSPYKRIIKEELPLNENQPYTFNTSKSKNYYNINEYLESDEHFNEDSLFEILKKIQKFDKSIVIIDSLLNLPLKDFKEFMNKLTIFSIESRCNLMINLNKGLLNSDDDYVYSSYLADLELEFIENESGFSKDIDGKINVNYKSIDRQSITLIYKLKENGIDVFNNLVI